VLVAVTGGARGIGLAIARAFASRGDRVVVGDLDVAAAAEAAADLGGVPVRVDVRDPVSFAAFLDAAGDAAGPIDVLVNNAGVAPHGRFLDLDPAALDCVLEVNLRGVVHGMRLALPPMIARGSGHVVNIASLSSRIPLPGAAVYAATKHAVLGLTESVRVEIRGSGVRLTTVMPTFVSTEIISGLPLRGPVPTIPPERVAAAVVKAVDRGGPPVLTVPRWLGFLPWLANTVPHRMRDALLTGGWGSAEIDTAARDAYEKRVAQQYDAASSGLRSEATREDVADEAPMPRERSERQ
jgi:NAD(P)-dependent dehydrogenase (short-subunit alcohol dehydrogenase family)